MAWTAKRLAVSAFLIAHLAALGIWNLPACALKDRCLGYCSYYMMPTGLWQFWGMFAPEPVKDTAVLEALVTDAKGLLHEYPFPATEGMSPWRAALDYRMAKLETNAAPEELRATREMIARHAVRGLRLAAADFPVDVRLQYQVRATPAPGSPAGEAPPPTIPVPVMSYRYPTLADVQP